MIPVLETPRLILRGLRLADASDIQHDFPHMEILRYMRTPPWPYPPDGAEQFIRDVALPGMEKGSDYHWAITLTSEGNDKPIGLIALHPQSETENRGFWLMPRYQRQGLMKEAVLAVTDFAFYELGMPHLHLVNAEPNIGSHRLKELAGASIVAVKEDEQYIGGRFRSVFWLLTADDWERNRANFLQD